ncbi:MAG: hypothetical protein EKK55_24335 [Rhodocyclaceae bacterium]|nr:MAG: hypothetical protein EKK55_24335 [Rhodocyclaceae bacterium]
MRRTTLAHVDTVLACDPAIERENGGREVEAARAALLALPADAPRTDRALAEAGVKLAREAMTAKLDAFRKSRDLSSITVPADACRITIRPLTAEERLAVGEAGLEAAFAARGDDAAAGRAAAVRVARLEAQARVQAGVVRAVEGGVEVPGAELIESLPPALLFPAIIELSGAIARLSELDPLGKGR